jgi:hypothetical protein
MNQLQSTPTLDIFQTLLGLFNSLKQDICESTLWVCDRGSAQSLIINLQETRSLLILQVQSVKGSLNLQITPATVLISGRRPVAPDAAPDQLATYFHSLIPLPIAIQPQTAIVELNGSTLTLTMMKSAQPQPTVNLTVGYRSQPLPYVMAISAAPAMADLN